jgi:hypothetical protein
MAALQLGRTIEAIKIVRDLEGLGLKEAKDRVDRYLASDPGLREKIGSSQTGFKNGCLVVGVGLVVLLGVAAFLFLQAQR